MSKKKFILQLGLILLALIASIYATVIHYEEDSSKSICNINATFSCSTVDASQYSEIFGLSVGIFGIIYALFNLAVLLIKKFKTEITKSPNFAYVEQMNLVINTVGILGSLSFIGIQLFVIKAICLNCMIFHLGNFGFTALLYKEALKNSSVEKKQ